jgi:predicted transcriptional regulator
VPTSVHTPAPLLQALDRHARRLGLSRNRVIVRALERELGGGLSWSDGFFETLAGANAGDRRAIAEMLEDVRSRRTSKAAPKL